MTGQNPTAPTWWEPRRADEPTAEYLARVLGELGATELADNARAFHYDDYRCDLPHDQGDNIHRLIAEVEEWAVMNRHPRRARDVMAAARTGEFDGTKAEADAWFASPDGQETLAALFGEGDPGPAVRDRGVRPGWYWSSGWTRAHYVADGAHTLCRYVARTLVANVPPWVERCKHCAKGAQR